MMDMIHERPVQRANDDWVVARDESTKSGNPLAALNARS